MRLSQTEIEIIDRVIRNADSFGTNMVSTACEELKDHGFEWTDDHEDYIFNTYVGR